jgi:hypothetical protein
MILIAIQIYQTELHPNQMIHGFFEQRHSGKGRRPF